MFRLYLALLITCLLPLYAEINILAIAGSTREGSFNKKLLAEAAELAKQEGASVNIINLKDFPIPFYDADLEAKQGMPGNAKRLRKLMINSQAIIIASPEYNGSVSAVLKNALDWTSRSENGQGSRDAFKGKKFAIISASPGQGGGKRGLLHLRAIIEDVGGIVLTQQLSVPNAHVVLTPEGTLKNPQIKEELRKLIHELIISGR